MDQGHLCHLRPILRYHPSLNYVASLKIPGSIGVLIYSLCSETQRNLESGCCSLALRRRVFIFPAAVGFFLVVLACSIYITRISEGMYCSRDGGWPIFQNGALVLASGIACVLLSPGAVVSGVLYLREDFLRQHFAETLEKDRVQGKLLANGKH
jgi:hypothetical protein